MGLPIGMGWGYADGVWVLVGDLRVVDVIYNYGVGNLINEKVVNKEKMGVYLAYMDQLKLGYLY